MCKTPDPSAFLPECDDNDLESEPAGQESGDTAVYCRII